MARLVTPKQQAVREDFFTEALAAALEEDPDLAAGFLARLTAKSDLPRCPISDIRTQEAFEGSRIDLLLELTDGSLVAVENKLDAQEGDGQLAKYLCLDELRCVAFVAPAPRHLEPEVVGHHKFLCSPAPYKHFRWEDFYPLIAAAGSETTATSAARRGLLGLFDYLGYAPPLGMIGDVQDVDPRRRAQSKKRMDSLMRLARNHVYELGFEPEGYWEAQITTKVWPGHSPSKLWIDGFSQPGLLALRIYFATESQRDRAARALASPGAVPAQAAVDVFPFPSTRKHPSAQFAIKMVVSLHALLLGCETAEAVSERLRQFVAAAVGTATMDSQHAV